MSELVGRLLLRDEPSLTRLVRELVALADDDDREVLAALVPVLDLAARLLDRDRLLGDQDHVRAAGDPAHDRDPARVPAHDLDDHDAVVRLGGRVQPVDRLGADRDGGVEAERVVGRGQVVVDRLRDADDREVVLLVAVAPRRRACPRRRSRRARRGPPRRSSRARGRRRPRPCTGSSARCRGSSRRAAGAPRSRAGRAARTSPSTSPRHPARIPTTSSPRTCERRATARMTAFRPGQSPPPVRIPTRIPCVPKVGVEPTRSLRPTGF